MSGFPATYADWVRCFDALQEGGQDDEVLLSMERGAIEWTGGVADKITRRMYEVLELRLQQVSRQMTAELSRARAADTDVVTALLNARRRFAVVKRFASIAAFPEPVRKTMTDIVAAYVRDTQSSLEDSAKNDRTGQLRMVIKNNSLLRYEELQVKHDGVLPSSPAAQPAAGPNSRKRRVIL
ncbi:hypothetical protein N0M98_05680 [Paenibacillus doosanensis]|uniref:Uncharacterized protein n=1 Tax=Paenibacillus konkukensis TaxID=2020716 RepID=A0ABY4RQE8_9BACL|nr:MULTISPECIES: hypothetical protein [Paenibacillus]MCS7459626.1 hypothetical protein [Paenibacillus doosanensis]UQZ84714.1 hypothetical protein SK3146_03969 [Paenibacillus konkukensis]